MFSHEKLKKAEAELEALYTQRTAIRLAVFTKQQEIAYMKKAGVEPPPFSLSQGAPVNFNQPAPIPAFLQPVPPPAEDDDWKYKDTSQMTPEEKVKHAEWLAKYNLGK